MESTIDNNIVITIPEGIPAPKFDLFQKVWNGSRAGTVVGYRWISALEALAENLDSYGWAYDVSYLFGKQPEEAFDCPSSDWEVFERSLKVRL